MRNLLLAFTAIVFGIVMMQSQSIEKTWQAETVKTLEGSSRFNVNNTDTLQLSNGEFSFYLNAADSVARTGNYLVQNNLFVLFYDNPTNKVERFIISDLTDSTLVFADKELTYTFRSYDQKVEAETPIPMDAIVPSQGFSMGSLARGAIGMVVLLLLSYLLSSNRRAINWKTIGFGLAAQVLLAIGVLKVPFVQAVFETVGKMFVKVLEFTQAGSAFLLGGMMDVNSFGFIFLFQVLPTIIFFSALTSLLFYLGVIQKVVSA
ncbi:MAG TPA: Na+ dependent nucleoside transporter N-terminal domain-containing protein, partial [Aquaticitalea sp.]|nr:Na+ dependent nucleoside transporter N-terminal domain-containing protein [Aquaticitalea sp.]